MDVGDIRAGIGSAFVTDDNRGINDRNPFQISQAHSDSAFVRTANRTMVGGRNWVAARLLGLEWLCPIGIRGQGGQSY